MKRIFLFLATNFAILIVLSVTLRLLGVERILDESGSGLNLQALLIFAAVFGFGGSFVSLAISKWMAKRMTGAQVIEQPRSQTEVWLVDTVRRQARQAGIAMPEVAIYESPDVNAFATGMRRNAALVAVSTGLLNAMDRDEAEAVLGHEITHVANGDMVTLTIIQGVLNTFVIFVARIVASQFDRAQLLIYLALQLAFGVLASMIVAWFSRRREFRADAGGARLESAPAMVSALESLRAHADARSGLPDNLAAFGIHGGGLGRLFATHPPLEERIARLEAS